MSQFNTNIVNSDPLSSLRSRGVGVQNPTPSSSNQSTQSTSNTTLLPQEMSEAEVNKLLGIYIPDTVLTERIPDWDNFLTILRVMYVDNLATISDIKAIFNDYLTKVPDNKKHEVNFKLSELLQQSEAKKALMDSLWHVADMEEDFNRFVGGFDQETQEKIAYFIATGEDVSGLDELINEKLKLETEQAQEAIQQKLSMSRKSQGLRVDANQSRESYKIREGISPLGNVITEEDLDRRFSSPIQQVQVPQAQSQPLQQPKLPARTPSTVQSNPPQTNSQNSSRNAGLDQLLSGK